MAKPENSKIEVAAAVGETKTPHRVISGTVLGDPIETGDRAEKRLRPHKQHKVGSTVHLTAKDAKALIAQGVVEPIK